ncbi:MAG: MgtE intracellular region [Synergistaceae bacterium]|jgi:flagellar motility protein MotE (MotC chaperone)|nr:MgtE intracellular region [Synergistaceae bacterium]
MADPQEREPFTAESATPESPAQDSKRKKKKKKKRGCGFFILLILLAAGVSAGLQASGSVDLRPFVYTVIPRIPKVGESLKEILGIPDSYSLSVIERRRQELEEWEAVISESVRSMDARLAALDDLSGDISARERDLVYEREDLAARLEALSNDMASSAGANVSEAQGDEIRDIIGTFGQMSVRNAAAIVEKLNPSLAVAILDGLPEDTRASILGKIEAATAAVLTERLTEVYRGRNQ